MSARDPFPTVEITCRIGLTHAMKASKYYLLWTLAALVLPLLVATSLINNQELIIALWPSSIFLLSLGSEEVPALRVVTVWATSVSANIALYLIVAFALRIVASLVSRNDR